MMRKLDKLPEKIRKKVEPKALRAAVKPMVKDAKKGARRNKTRSTGLLATSIGVRLKTYRRGKNRGMTMAIWGPRTKFKSVKAGGTSIHPAKYAHLIEFGTAPHAIRAGRKMLAFDDKGENVVLSKVDHPGSPARPFMRPAFTKNKRRAIRLMVGVINAALRKERTTK